jgi:hypothetical protein
VEDTSSMGNMGCLNQMMRMDMRRTANITSMDNKNNNNTTHLENMTCMDNISRVGECLTSEEWLTRVEKCLTTVEERLTREEQCLHMGDYLHTQEENTDNLNMEEGMDYLNTEEDSINYVNTEETELTTQPISPSQIIDRDDAGVCGFGETFAFLFAALLH